MAIAVGVNLQEGQKFFRLFWVFFSANFVTETADEVSVEHEIASSA
jgi:hypothetical protein